jgi:hypothetical protein
MPHAPNNSMCEGSVKESHNNKYLSFICSLCDIFTKCAKWTTQHNDIVKRHLVMFFIFILGRVFFNYIRATNYLIDVRKAR